MHCFTFFQEIVEVQHMIDIVESLIKNNESIGVRMLIKLHFLHSRPDFFRITVEIIVKNKDKGFTRISKVWWKHIKKDEKYAGRLLLVYKKKFVYLKKNIKKMCYF